MITEFLSVLKIFDGHQRVTYNLISTDFCALLSKQKNIYFSLRSFSLIDNIGDESLAMYLK